MANQKKGEEKEGESARAIRAANNAAKKKDLTPENPMHPEYEDRFTRLEGLVESMAVTVKALAAKPKKRKKSKSKHQEDEQKPKKRKKVKDSRSNPSVVIADTQDFSEVEGLSVPASDLQANAPVPDVTAPAAISASVSNVVTRPDVTEVNKNEGWAAWLLANGALPPNNKPMNSGTIQHYDTAKDAEQSLQNQVRNILENTASHMSKGMVKKPYPYCYVRRGDEKKHATINSVTLGEHVWGILAMVKDPDVPASIKPALLEHLDEVAEDSMEFEWQAVRRWSEEVFSLVSEGRLPQGWSSTGKIQLLRMSIARTSTAKISGAGSQDKARAYHNQAFPDNKKSAPPCVAYNSAEGCSHPQGHVVNGRRRQHICAYCFSCSGATFYHSEVNCRNKNRDKVHHF